MRGYREVGTVGGPAILTGGMHRPPRSKMGAAEPPREERADSERLAMTNGPRRVMQRRWWAGWLGNNHGWVLRGGEQP